MRDYGDILEALGTAGAGWSGDDLHPNAFQPQTAVLTRDGVRPLMALRPGMLVLTRDHGYCPVLWCGPVADARTVPGQMAADAPYGLAFADREMVLADGQWRGSSQPDAPLQRTDPVGTRRSAGTAAVLRPMPESRRIRRSAA